ncbi:hypothetical protein JYP52_21575 [Nitratireductor aquibiodomus]|uniref:hypothetical protein n=1 Tax=Nitratireductor aquibiodomus TaxID=204799 RepID=UPI0019D336D1|nr:hypothetical protein [Nitratireductor aquibiodomus]MBN7763733.1 hypothetical protein [Nitratireductor aquibiodomus]
MPIIIKKKQRVNVDPVVDDGENELLVEGYSAAQSIEIANKALDDLVIFLAKKAAREDYERSTKETLP